MRFLSRTPVRTFIVYPIVTLLWELITRGDRLIVNPWFLPLMIWGYLQYRLCGRYRIRIGGGGPGLERPPEELVSTGPYAYTRNPMYLGMALIYAGLAIGFDGPIAFALLPFVLIAIQTQVIAREERYLEAKFGDDYRRYKAEVRRWL